MRSWHVVICWVELPSLSSGGDNFDQILGSTASYASAKRYSLPCDLHRSLSGHKIISRPSHKEIVRVHRSPATSLP